MTQQSPLKVVEINTTTSEINKQAVERLEELLRLAKEGELVEMVCVFKTSPAHGANYGYAYTGSDDMFMMQGALSRAIYHLNQRMDMNAGS